LKITCPVPSALPGCTFHLTLDGGWAEMPSSRPHHDPAAVAADHALSTIRNITAGYLTTDTVTATARINTVLGHAHQVPHLPVRLSWAQAQLTADPEAVQATITHQRRLREHEQHRIEQDRHLQQARTLHATLMSDPSLALSYWFSTAPHSVDAQTLDRLEALFSHAAAYAPQGQ
jgi:hypothetical protein